MLHLHRWRPRRSSLLGQAVRLAGTGSGGPAGDEAAATRHQGLLLCGDELVKPRASTDSLDRNDASNPCQECGGRVFATDAMAVGDNKLKPLLVVDDVPSRKVSPQYFGGDVAQAFATQFVR